MAATRVLTGLAFVASAGASAAHAAPGGGGYQSFIDGYAKKYEGGAGAGGNYQQYMKTYTKGGGNLSSGTMQNFQQYFDKFMHMSGANASGSLQDYQKFFQKYMSGQGSSQGFQKFMAEYAKNYMGAGNFSGNAENYQQYESKYASGGGNSYQKFMQGYMPKNAGAANMNFTSKLQQFAEGMEFNPSECTTAECLCTWHKNRVGVLKATVPSAFANFSVAASEKEYKGMLAKFAKNHSTSIAELGLSKSCQPKEAAATAAAALVEGGASSGMLLFSLLGLALAMPASAVAAGALVLRRRRHSASAAAQDSETDNAYYILA
jgi:hypothetical protein